MNIKQGIIVFIIIGGLLAALITNYLGLYILPGQCQHQCKKMCPNCKGLELKPGDWPLESIAIVSAITMSVLVLLYFLYRK